MEPALITYSRPQGKGIKLHLGCGDYWMEGAINIDRAIYAGTDMLFDISQKLPFQDEVVAEIQCHDVIEHFSPDQIGSMLDNWYQLLISQGQVIATLPNLDGLIELYQQTASEEQKQLVTQAIYGIEKDHKWGYNSKTLKKLFEDHQFKAEVLEVLTGKDQFPRLEVHASKP